MSTPKGDAKILFFEKQTEINTRQFILRKTDNTFQKSVRRKTKLVK